MELRWLVALIMLAPVAQACKCVTSFSICNTVGVTHFIFAGTVESIEPSFLSRWDAASQSTLPQLNEAYAEAQANPSAESLANVKDAFLKVVPSLSQSARGQLEAAKTVLEVASLFNAQVYQGIRVRLKVRTFFKREDDDRKSSDRAGDIVEVWTTFGDCGVDFQSGETYLVYADEDEGTDQLFSDKCSRTRRLSDAGEDLAYLFFYKDRRKESSRVEGFATSDRRSLLGFGELPEKVNSPASGLTIELRSSGGLIRYTETDSNGKYLFDGLAAGDYKISAFPGGHMLSPELLSGPYSINMKESSCVQQLLVVRTKL